MSTKIPIESIEAEVARRERDEWHGRGGMTHGIAFMQGVRWAEQQHVVPEFVHEVIQVHLDTHDGRTHSEKCYRRHADCLARLVRDCIEEWGTDGE